MYELYTVHQSYLGQNDTDKNKNNDDNNNDNNNNNTNNDKNNSATCITRGLYQSQAGNNLLRMSP